MSAYANDKRNDQRRKEEFVVGVKTRAELNIAYTIDISRSGIKVGSPLRHLPVGEPVELVMDKRGEKHPFAGRVVRDDGASYINRIGRSANAVFIRIDDEQFSDFVIDNYFV
jgi:hypothetical protein